MRGVPAVVEGEAGPRPGYPSLDRIELGERPVLVVTALDEKDGAIDPGKVALDVPGGEGGVEPDVVPGVECRARVAVIAAHALGKVGGLESLPGSLDTGDR